MMLLRDLCGETGGSRTIYRSDSERSEGGGAAGGCRGACFFARDSWVRRLRSSAQAGRRSNRREVRTIRPASPQSLHVTPRAAGTISCAAHGTRMAREKFGGGILVRCVHYTSAICTSCFPRFFPCSMPINACGAFSMPRAMSSR